MKKIPLFISGLALCLQTSYAQHVFSVLDVFPGTGKSSNPAQLTSSGGKLFFAGTLLSNGTELWVTDGTILNTNMVKDIKPGSPSGSPSNIFAYNGKILFVADNGSTGAELWISDGTDAGTTLVKDICSGGVSSNPEGFYLHDGKVYFTAGTFAEGPELWITDGTTAGTHLVKDINPGSNSSFIENMCSYNGKLFFSANNGINGQELWISDGTDTGTHMVKDLSAGTYNNSPKKLTAFKNRLYYMCECGVMSNPQGLASTDGTDTGTKKPSPLVLLNSTSDFLIVYNNELYYNGPELYKYDGTTSTLVKEFIPGAAGAILYSPFIMNNKLYFVAETPAEGKELWVTDGTAAGTQLVKDIIAGSGGSNPSNFVQYRYHTYFSADNATGDRQVFWTDGTTTGTTAIMPVGGLIDPLTTGGFTGFADYNGSLYFAAYYDTKCAELWSLKDTATYAGVNNATLSKDDFYLYPNPNTGSFTLKLNDPDLRNAAVDIYDAVGRQIYHSDIIKSPIVIDLESPSGVYVVRVKLDDRYVIQKITVQ